MLLTFSLSGRSTYSYVRKFKTQYSSTWSVEPLRRCESIRLLNHHKPSADLIVNLLLVGLLVMPQLSRIEDESEASNIRNIYQINLKMLEIINLPLGIPVQGVAALIHSPARHPVHRPITNCRIIRTNQQL